ncbi:MAG TPA: glucan biosynthesis protein, partial [Pirellulales bacterium]|nr:glucan biosynthesis protein [Pirellulales bacterium]
MAVAFRPAGASAAELKSLGEPQKFNFKLLKQQAQERAAAKYRAPRAELPQAIAHLNWDQMQAIHFKAAHALWHDAPSKFRIRFFHLGLYNKLPVQMFEVRDGAARELAYDPSLFDFDASGIDASSLPADLGFAGFQVAYQADWRHDVAAFQGASYFRAVGSAKQYGLSARGLAIDCGLSKPEEFPNFVAYWLERPAPADEQLVIYALLDSPRVTGAYRFVIRPGEPLLMDVDAAL